MKAEFCKTKIDSRNASQLLGQDVLIIANYEKAPRLIHKLQYGEFVELEYQEARHYPRLQAYWAMCNDIAENHKAPGFYDEYGNDRLNTRDKVDWYLRIKAGFVEFKIGNVIKPRSIAYENCTEDEFKHYLKSIQPIVEEITGMDYQSFRSRRNEK